MEMSKTTRLLLFILTGFGVLITALVFVTWWNRPLGEPLLIPSPTFEPASPTVQKGLEPESPANTQIIERSTMAAITPTPTASAIPENTKPTLDEPQPMYILAAGIDRRQPGYQGGLADVIRIVRIDFATPRVTVLTLPRDLWVELPGIKEEYPNLTHGKINTAYSYGTPAMDRYQGEGGGPGLLSHTIAHNYGLFVDHYAVLNMEVFVDIVDALDGIDLYLHRTWDGRADTDNPDLEDWVFEEGEHHMEGDEALRFARIRLNDTEIIRTDNQTAVICAIKDKMLHPSVFGALPNLVKAFLGRIQTDLPPAQISQLIALLPKLQRENLLFIRFPNAMLVPGRAFDPSLNNTTFVWDIPIEDVRSFVQAFMSDTIPVDIGGGGGRFCP